MMKKIQTVDTAKHNTQPANFIGRGEYCAVGGLSVF